MNRENIFCIISIVAMIIAFIILGRTYFEHPTEKSFGERFVLDHYRINLLFYNAHFKPITLFAMFGLISFIFGLEGNRTFISRRSTFFKRAMLMVSFVFIFIFFYEVFQVFLFWSATYTVNLGKTSVDELHTDLSPSGLYVNFTAMTKFYSLLLFIGIYSFYFFNGMLRMDDYDERRGIKENIERTSKQAK